MCDPSMIPSWIASYVEGMRLSRAKTLAVVVSAALLMKGVGALALTVRKDPGGSRRPRGAISAAGWRAPRDRADRRFGHIRWLGDIPNEGLGCMQRFSHGHQVCVEQHIGALKELGNAGTGVPATGDGGRWESRTSALCGWSPACTTNPQRRSGASTSGGCGRRPWSAT